MAIDPRIAMAAAAGVPNIGGQVQGFANDLINLQNQESNREFRERQMALQEKRLGFEEQRFQQEIDAQRAALEKAGKAESARDWGVDMMRVRPLLKRGDVAGARGIIERRIEGLQAAGIDSSNSQRFLQLIDANPQAAFEDASNEVSIVQRLGLIGEEKGGFTLSQGQKRFDASGNEIAGVDPKSDALSPEAFAQQVHLRRLQAAAAAAPMNSVARALKEQQIAMNELKMADMQGKIDERNQKLGEVKRKGENAKRRIQDKSDLVISTIDKAIDQATDGIFNTGVFSQVLKGVGGTDARKLANTLKTLSAQLAFSEITALKEAGVSLGATSEGEIDLLASNIASLDQATDESDLIDRLGTIRTQMAKMRDLASVPPDEPATTSPAQAATPDAKIVIRKSLTDMTTEELEQLLQNPGAAQ